MNADGEAGYSTRQMYLDLAMFCFFQTMALGRGFPSPRSFTPAEADAIWVTSQALFQRLERDFLTDSFNPADVPNTFDRLNRNQVESLTTMITLARNVLGDSPPAFRDLDQAIAYNTMVFDNSMPPHGCFENEVLPLFLFFSRRVQMANDRDQELNQVWHYIRSGTHLCGNYHIIGLMLLMIARAPSVYSFTLADDETIIESLSDIMRVGAPEFDRDMADLRQLLLRLDPEDGDEDEDEEDEDEEGGVMVTTADEENDEDDRSGVPATTD